MHDIKQRYRRSLLGPFWLTLSMGIMVGALALIYSRILDRHLADYLPYIASGFVVWGFVSSFLLTGSKVFISSERMIRQLPAPLSLYVYRDVWTGLIILAHNIWIYVVAVIWFDKLPGASVLAAIPALALLVLNGYWLVLLFGLLSTRFRDVPQLVASVVQVMFFITPIIWMPEMMPGRAVILDFNPFYHLVELMRAPLLGSIPAIEHWLVALGLAIVGWTVTLVLFTAYRWRIAYWL